MIKEKKGKIRILNYPKYFVIHKEKQSLFCFGAQHTYDPNHKQFLMIEKLWKEFLVATKGQKKL